MNGKLDATRREAGADVAALRAELGAARREAEARVVALRAELDAIVAGSADANLDDEHDPEGATVAFERQRTASLLAGAEADLQEIDAAVARVAAGTYGRCETCGGPIGSGRLGARPAARTCVACAGAQRGLLSR